MARELPPDMMALSEAAAVAHREIFRTLATSPEALDVVATALSGHLAIYGDEEKSAARRQLTEEDYSRGSFRHGATRFELREGRMIVNLGVRRLDFERMLGTLRPARKDKDS